MIPLLRDYQRFAADSIKAQLPTNPVLVMPTGGGKTVTAATMVRESGLRTLWLAERRELIGQAAQSLHAMGLDVGVIMSGQPAYPNRPVQVASVQTLVCREYPAADLLVIDECHHTPGQRIQDVLKAYAGVPRVGLTATPFRLDGKPLGDTFGTFVIAAYPQDLIRDRWLVEPRVYAPPIDVHGIAVRKGEFQKGALGRAVNRPKLVGDVVHTWQRHASGLKTALFAVSVEHSRKLIEAFMAAGIPAEHIDGQTPSRLRDAALGRLASGRTLVLSNCQVITEGWDLPSLQCAIVARPTASLCLHIQIAGRVMRACPGKRGAVILDHAGNFLRHGRVTRRLEYSLTSPQPACEDTSLAVCRSCQRMVLKSRKACPECGASLEAVGGGLGSGPRKMPAQVDGHLEEFDAERHEREQERFLADAREIARAKNYRPGWVAKRFKEQFGSYPQTMEAAIA